MNSDKHRTFIVTCWNCMHENKEVLKDEQTKIGPAKELDLISQPDKPEALAKSNQPSGVSYITCSACGMGDQRHRAMEFAGFGVMPV